MKRKYLVPVFFISIITLLVLLFLFGHKTVNAPTLTSLSPTPEASSPSAQFKGDDNVLKNALNLYLSKKREGVDMTNGPCLGKIGADWVLDIAHNPRQPIDDKAENQCPDFINGNAHHFIELDTDGKLIRSN